MRRRGGVIDLFSVIAMNVVMYVVSNLENIRLAKESAMDVGIQSLIPRRNIDEAQTVRLVADRKWRHVVRAERKMMKE